MARSWRLYLLELELRLAPTEPQRIFLLTIGIGALCGLGAVAFHLSIRLFEAHLIDPALAAPGNQRFVWIIVTPLVGGLACGALLQYVFPGARGSGIPQVKAAFASTPATVPLRDGVGKFLVSSLQIGSGASLGREGPTVQICASIASLLGRVAGVSANTQRRLLPVGVAAGIAAAFNAPIAAVTFTIEEIVGTLDQTVLSGVIVAAALAAVIERSLLGENPVFDVPGSYGLRHPSSLILYAAIGLAAGLAAIVFTSLLLTLRQKLRQTRVVPAWATPSIGGGLTGALAVVGFLVFRSSGVTGGGYATLGRALQGEYLWWVLLGLGALKLLATAVSYASGGAGGIFAPSLFIGGMLGGAVGTLGANWFGQHDEPIGAFALVGMGAMFAGVIRAPITSVLIIVEMTGGYSLILPLMIANMTAYVLARRFRAQPIYEALLEQDGMNLQRDDREAHFPVSRALGDKALIVLAPAMSGEEVLRRCGGANAKRTFPVLDAERRVIGLVTAEDVQLLKESPELVPATTAFDLMHPPLTVLANAELGLAIQTMLLGGLCELPVTDAAGRLLGYVDHETIVQAHRVRLPPVATGKGLDS